MYHAEQTADRPLVHYWRQRLAARSVCSGPSQRETVLDLNDERCCLYGCDIMDMKMSPSHQRAAFAAVRDDSSVLVLKDVDDGAPGAPWCCTLHAPCCRAAPAVKALLPGPHGL